MGIAKFSLLSRRATLLGAAFVVAGCARTSEAQPEPTRVLFVCQYGSVKSAIAREHFRRLAAARGILARAESRGISPANHASPTLLAALEADHIDIRREPVQALTASDLSIANIIVVFDELPAKLGAWPVRDWSDLPSMNANYSEARRVLLERIGALLDQIEHSP